MKEDRLALIKAVDSGDTDLGIPPTSIYIQRLTIVSLSRLVTPIQQTSTRYLFQAHRGWRRATDTRKPPPASLCARTKPRDAQGLLLFR